MAERSFIDRVDDDLLVQVSQIAKLRGITVRGALSDFRQTCADVLADSKGVADEDIWRLRMDRCDIIAAEPNDAQLRTRVATAWDQQR